MWPPARVPHQVHLILKWLLGYFKFSSVNVQCKMIYEEVVKNVTNIVIWQVLFICSKLKVDLASDGVKSRHWFYGKHVKYNYFFKHKRDAIKICESVIFFWGKVDIKNKLFLFLVGVTTDAHNLAKFSSSWLNILVEVYAMSSYCNSISFLSLKVLIHK